ncbi:hypothetical protein [Adlercreutzia equolifaciens]|uniref:hypothetical protein n=1 Tax=Adlercreutzia equolifaciens TaxID=446660 RepID=UPI003AF14762
MFEFLSSPFGLVAVGLGVLAVAVLALCLWITTLDRRMRGMADGLETERRKVAELQMVIGRRANAARSYGNRGRAAAPAPAPAPVAAAAPAAPAGTAVPPRGAGAPVPMGASGGAAVPASAGAPAGAVPRGRGSRPASAGSGWTPSSIPMPAQSEVDAWVQGAPAVQQPIVVPDRKMSRKARREAERAFAARAAAELEARQARRAQEAAAAQRSFGAAPARAAAPARPAAAARPAAGVPAQAQGFAPVQPAYGAPSGARARHAR